MGKLYRPPFVGIFAFVSVLLAQPLGHSLLVLLRALVNSQGQEIGVSLALGVLGFVLVWVGLRQSETLATWLGFVGGILIWTGWFELTWEFFAQRFGVEPLMGADGKLAMSAGLQMIQASGLVMFAVLLFYYFNRETRCNAFKWLHRHAHMDPGRAGAGKDRDFARITAMETIFVIWFIYVINLTLYDDRLLGVRHPVTYVVFFGFLIWAVYLNTRLIKYARMAPAVRYAIQTTIITWMDIEVLSRWGLLKEVWLQPWNYGVEMGIVLAAFIIAGILVYLTPERAAKGKALDDVDVATEAV